MSILVILMKILIDNISIFTALPSKRFIDRGYMYIDKGVIVAIGEGSPPPELEFADYVIDGKYSVALPGFVVGIGNIIDYIFRFKDIVKKRNDVLSTLSLSDIQILSSITLASLALNGATSIATYVTPINHNILLGLALAATECWVRLRLIMPVEEIDHYIVEDIVKNIMKNIKEPDAISKGIISFGCYFKENISKEFIDIARALNIKLYIDESLLGNSILKDLYDNIIVLTRSGTSLDNIGISKVVALSTDQWKQGIGLVLPNPLNLNPRIFISTISKAINKSSDILYILCHYNPMNLGLGVSVLENGYIADFIILDYSKPPTGPIPITESIIVEEISMSNYVVETMLVAGELMLDQGMVLNIGEKHVKKAQAILSSLR